jgi:hypothetical protein
MTTGGQVTWLAREADLPTVPGGVRLGATDIELLVNLDEAGLDGAELHARAFVFLADGRMSGRMIADVQYFDARGGRHRIGRLSPWVDPGDSALWFGCATAPSDRAVRLLAIGLDQAPELPASSAYHWHSGFDQADFALRAWRRTPTTLPLTWEQVVERGLI